MLLKYLWLLPTYYIHLSNNLMQKNTVIIPNSKLESNGNHHHENLPKIKAGDLCRVSNNLLYIRLTLNLSTTKPLRNNDLSLKSQD
jgi:hypothetical protein